MLLRYFLSDLQMVQVSPVTVDINLLSHSICDYFLLYGPCILKSFCFFLDHISVYRNCNINWHPCSLFIITNYDIRFIIRNKYFGLHCCIHNTVTSSLWPVCTNFGTWQYWCLLYNSPPNPLHMLQYSSAHTASYLCMYCSFASIVHADMMRSNVLSNCLHSAFALCFCL